MYKVGLSIEQVMGHLSLRFTAPTKVGIFG